MAWSLGWELGRKKGREGQDWKPNNSLRFQVEEQGP